MYERKFGLSGVRFVGTPAVGALLFRVHKEKKSNLAKGGGFISLFDVRFGEGSRRSDDFICRNVDVGFLMDKYPDLFLKPNFIKEGSVYSRSPSST